MKHVFQESLSYESFPPHTPLLSFRQQNTQIGQMNSRDGQQEWSRLAVLQGMLSCKKSFTSGFRRFFLEIQIFVSCTLSLENRFRRYQLRGWTSRIFASTHSIWFFFSRTSSPQQSSSNHSDHQFVRGLSLTPLSENPCL